MEAISKTYFSRLFMKDFAFLVSVIAFLYILFLKIIDPEITPEVYRFSSQFFLLIVMLLGIWKFIKHKDFSYIAIFVINVVLYISFTISVGGGLSTGGNNDVYNWGLSTNTLLGLANYINLMPDGAQTWQGLRRDAFGAYIFNGIWASIFNRNVLFYTTINIFTISLLTQIAIYRLLFSSGTSKHVSLILSLFWAANPLVIYLHANYFLGQLLATLFLIIALICYQNSYQDGENRLMRVIYIVPAVFLMFITYQSGFFALLAVFFIGSYVLQLKKLSDKGEILPFNYTGLIYQIKIALLILIDIIIAVLICSLLSLDTSKHLLIQASYAMQVVAGWSLPLLNPLTLIGLPTSVRVEEPASYFSYFLVGSLFFALVGYRHILSFNCKSIAFWVVIALISMYLLNMEFNKRTNNYQIWKAASFLILPLAFIFIALVFDHILVRSEMPKAFLIIFTFIVSFHSFHYLSTNYFSSKQSVMDNFISLNEIIHKKKVDRTGIILDTNDFQDTFIAFNVFSKNSDVYTLSKWYGPSAKLADVDFSSMFVISKDCNPEQAKRYGLYDGASHNPLFFEFRNEGCGLLRRILSFNGLSLGENIGRWSLGNRVSFDLKMDGFKARRPTEIVFDLAPYLPPGVSNQNLKVFNSDNLVAQFIIDTETQIRIPLERSANSVKIEFLIEKTRRPMDYDLKSQDNREIALLFKSVGLYY